MSQEEITRKVVDAVGPVLAREGYELVLAEYVPRMRVLRLFIDHAQGVSLDDCTRVSHWVGDLLDGEGLDAAILGRYTLEVSSPGLDRPLVRPEHYQRFVGRIAQVQTREPVAGRRRFKGELAYADDKTIRLSAEGSVWEIPYTMIERANLVPDIEGAKVKP